MKIVLLVLAFVNGGYMLIDGIFVLLKGKYIGHEKPGPWANLFYKMEINVFKLGTLFIVFGMLWLIWLFGFWNKLEWSYLLGIVLAVLTLWYLPIGTFISLVTIISLLFFKDKIGY